MTRRITCLFVLVLAIVPLASTRAQADEVLQWNDISMATLDANRVNPFEAARVAAPVAAAALAVPLGHSFPFFALGGDDETRVNGVLECWSDEAMDDRDNLAGAALRAQRRFLGARRLRRGFVRTFCGSALRWRHGRYPRSR